jgi:hypothetical protein
MQIHTDILSSGMLHTKLTSGVGVELEVEIDHTWVNGDYIMRILYSAFFQLKRGNIFRN